MERALRFSSQERMRDKQDARERDDYCLRSGEVSGAELNRRNGLFSALDFSHASMRFRSDASL